MQTACGRRRCTAALLEAVCSHQRLCVLVAFLGREQSTAHRQLGQHGLQVLVLAASHLTWRRKTGFSDATCVQSGLENSYT